MAPRERDKVRGRARNANAPHLSDHFVAFTFPGERKDERSKRTQRGRAPRRDAAGLPAVGSVRSCVHGHLVYRREVTRTPLRTLAEEIGISKSGLDQFYKSQSYPGKSWPKLRNWYMEQRKRPVDDPQSPPEQILLSALHTFSGFPKQRRIEAMRETAEHYRLLCTRMKLPVPAWVTMLADVAEREARNPAPDEASMLIPSPPKPSA